jgi:hypothetical protein
MGSRVMIRVEPCSHDEWLVKVEGATPSQHRVRVTKFDLQRFAADRATPEQLLEATFRFLLEREPNTSILAVFDLPVIGRYFPEFETQISRYLFPD